MSGPEPITIIAIDSARPPQIRKDPYIELFFELSDTAPRQWCDDFNSSMQKQLSKPKVRADEGRFIETWVRRAEDIPAHLEVLKTAVHKCNELQQATALALANTVISKSGEATLSSAQTQLNAVISTLVFAPKG